MQLIERYDKLKETQIKYGNDRDLIEKQKDDINYEIASKTKEMEDASYHFTSTINDLKNQIQQFINTDDLILFKGSNSMNSIVLTLALSLTLSLALNDLFL